MKTKIIAEVGPNHNGSIERAFRIVGELLKTKCTAIKFQMANPDYVYSADAIFARYQKKNTNFKNIIEMSKKNQLTKEEHYRLFKYIKSKKKEYLCTPFDIQSLNFLLTKINLKKIKIASGEVFSLDILEELSKKKLEIIISTGMCNEKDIIKIIQILNKNFKQKICLMHCVSCYPAQIQDMNLNYINVLKKYSNYLGLSDHTIDNTSSLLSLSLGVTVIEKHVTLNKKLKGPDHQFSLNIKEFKNFLKNIENAEIALGIDKKIFNNRQKEIIRVSRKSIVSKKKLEIGEKITRKNICFKRPGTGINPINLKEILNKKVLHKIGKDRVIKEEHFK